MKNKKRILFIAMILVSSDSYAENVFSAYVFIDELNVRLSPSTSGTITNKLYYGQRVDVFGIRAGWVRISNFYPSSIEGKGDTLVSRWVDAKYLHDSKPKERAGSFSLPSNRLARATKGSDDFHKHGKKFYKAAENLISQKKCSFGDFEEMGGWVKSTSHKGLYFTYCGGMAPSKRIYLRISDEKAFFVNPP